MCLFLGWYFALGAVAGRSDLWRAIGRRTTPEAARLWNPFVVTAEGLVAVAAARVLSQGPTLPCLTACVALVFAVLSSGRRLLPWFLFGETLALGLWGFAAGLGLIALATELLGRRRVAAFAVPTIAIVLPLASSWFGEDVHCAWAVIALLSLLVFLANGWMRMESRHRAAMRRAGYVTLAAVASIAGAQVYAARVGFRSPTTCQQVVIGAPWSKGVCLTFDDGPDPKYTPEVLSILRQAGVKATFFMVGEKVDANPWLAAQVAAEGHEIGNHSYTHRNLSNLKGYPLTLELDWTQEAIRNACGKEPVLFRPPRGLGNQAVYDLLKRKGLTLALFSLSSHDWMQPSSSGIVNSVARALRPGEILLLHDSGDFLRPSGASRASTLRALPGIIAAAKARGFAFMTVSEMLQVSRENGWNMGVVAAAPQDDAALTTAGLGRLRVTLEGVR